jgi:hypothetical protein
VSTLAAPIIRTQFNTSRPDVLAALRSAQPITSPEWFVERPSENRIRAPVEYPALRA